MASLTKPNVFNYHDYRAYLRDAVLFIKAKHEFNSRSLAKELNIATGYLAMIIGGKRKLSIKVMDDLSRLLKLSKTEKNFLQSLMQVSDAKTPEERKSALAKVQSYSNYKLKNQYEVEVFNYLSNWVNVAIRELAQTPDFVADPVWIKKRLRKKVSLSLINSSLKFLITNKFISRNMDGKMEVLQKELECEGGIYSFALRDFHIQMLENAKDSLLNASGKERLLLSRTASISKEDYELIVEKLNKIREEITELTSKNLRTSAEVYHFELALFPLTKNAEQEND